MAAEEFNHLPQMAEALQRAASELVRTAAFDVEHKAKQVVPVDTGALKNSIQTVIIDAYNAEVDAGMDYSADVEFGTIHMAAQPYMTPAANAVRPQFQAAFQ